MGDRFKQSQYKKQTLSIEMSQQFLKLLIIGDSGVGKSCILSRYCQDKFSAAFFNTIGVDFKTKQIVLNGTKCKMQIWDTAGQERFRTITSNYYRGAHGILVVFDVTSKASFKNLDFWLSQIQRNGNKNIITIIVGNKCDIVGKRQVSQDEAIKYARSNNVQYIQTSAYNAANINLVFQTIGKHILRKKLGNTQQKKQEKMEKKKTLATDQKQEKSRCC